jgi:hypothetical protein
MLFQCWIDDDDGSLLFTTDEKVIEHRNNGLLSQEAVLLYEFEAESWTEALSEHYTRQNWETLTQKTDK